MLLAASFLLHGLLGLALWPAQPLPPAGRTDAVVVLFEAAPPQPPSTPAQAPPQAGPADPPATLASPATPVLLPPTRPAAKPARRHSAAPIRRLLRPAFSPPPSPAASADRSPALAAADAAVVEAAWRRCVSDWLQSHKLYPESARRHGDQGTALVQTRIGRDGSVLEFVLLQPTGSPRLDAAVASLMRNARVPAFPASMPQPEATIRITLNYMLSN